MSTAVAAAAPTKHMFVTEGTHRFFPPAHLALSAREKSIHVVSYVSGCVRGGRSLLLLRAAPERVDTS